VEIPRLLLNDSLSSAALWQDMLDRNDSLKRVANFVENISFSSGAGFTSTYESDSIVTRDVTWPIEDTHALTGALGYTFGGIGASSSLSVTMTSEESNDTTNTETYNRVVSYTLADDDENDNFTIDIKDDPVYGTPVFDLVSGKSMCPWEEGTLNREEVSLRIDRSQAINVPSNDAAVFTLHAGNLSDEFKVYLVSAFAETNPDGAIITIIGGSASTGEIDLEIDPGDEVQLIMTVERGPVAYDYEDLTVAIYTECEDDRRRNLGIDTDPKFHQEIEFDVHFIEPCSEVDISFPMQDWVVTPTQDTQLTITLSDYNLNDADLELIKVQYRREGGDGAWINLDTVYKADLGPVFENVVWDMRGLSDGPYELRALTNCINTSLDPGISTVLKGRLETRPPELFGSPQPSDGLLSAYDEISITFNEEIDCNTIIQADQLGNNNIGLYDATTGALIDATISCSDDKIIIVPNIQNKFIENTNLRVEVDDILDLSGNPSEHIQWEFLVDRNPLLWLGSDVDELMTVNEPNSVTRQIKNRGGAAVIFNIANVPSWLTVSPNATTINPDEIIDITFTFQDDVLIGDYQQEILLTGSEGSEPLDVRLKVRCTPPNWNFTNKSSFENSMNFTFQIDFFGDQSEDISDMIAAYINGEIRGLANIEYSVALDKYYAFLTVYHDGSGDPIEFNVFDGNQCVVYAEIVEQFNFENGGLEGSPLTPTVVHVQNVIEKEYPLSQGWNWLSINIDYGNNEINNVLSSLSAPDRSTIKDDDDFANNNSGIWIGSLSDLSYDSRYMYQATVADTLTLKGTPYDVASSPINILAGWNWIGFTPQQGVSLDAGLQSLTPLNGDIVKSQTEFAQYVAGVGWIGNLNFLEPGKGYLLNIQNTGTLIYPNVTQSSTRSQDSRLKSNSKKRWEVDFNQYQENMNIIAVINDSHKMPIGENDEISLYVNDALRGSAKATYVEEFGGYRFFITGYNDIQDELITFKYYNSKSTKEYRVVESELFRSNTVSGTIQEPLALSLMSGDILDDLPNQFIHQSGVFVDVDVSTYVDQATACSVYDIQQVITEGSDTAAPTCERSVFPNSMTVVMKVVYGDSVFNSIDDRVLLYDPNDVIIECASPIENPLLPGEQIFFLNVGGDAASYPVRMEFFSEDVSTIYNLDSVFSYVEGTALGMPDDPFILDLSPIKFQIENAILTATVTDPDWVGTQQFIISISECEGGMSGIDTVFYSNQCPDNFNVTSSILHQDTSATRLSSFQTMSISAEIINSNMTPQLHGPYLFSSGQSIELLPDFEVNSNLEMILELSGCIPRD